MLDLKKNRNFDFTTAVLNLTYRCNSNCKFCFNKSLLNRAPEYSLSEIKKIYTSLKKKKNIAQIILSGGEPTLHSQFWEVMDFLLTAPPNQLQISLNTNSLNFNQKIFTKKLESLFRQNPEKRKKLSLSLSDVNHWPAKTKLEKLKVNGVKNAIKFSQKELAKLVVVITITKQNYQIIPQLVRFASKQINHHGVIVVRGLYLGKSMGRTQKQEVVPIDFKSVIESTKKALKIILKNPKAKITLFNLPLCYFKEWKDLAEVIPKLSPWPHELRISLRKGKRARTRLFQKEVWSKRECNRCALNPVCNRIQGEYIHEYKYPPLSPF